MATRRPVKERERELPVQQLTVLAICRFAEPIASTSIFPYLPEMIRSFNVPEKDVGKWAGITSACFSLFQAVAGVPWGRFSDTYGRKLSILLGLTSTMLTSLLWGFSWNLPMAITARALAGAGNGNVGIMRTTVAEMVPFKELQPRAFILMPLVANIGSIFGPSIGGTLANPFNVKPGDNIEKPSLFQAFPYALPNIVIAAVFLLGITVGFLFLKETRETLQGKRDLGVESRERMKAGARYAYFKMRKWLSGNRDGSAYASGEMEPLLKSAHQEDARTPASPVKPLQPPPNIREVLTQQAIINLAVFTLLALHSMAFDQLLPVYMQYPALWSQSPDTTEPLTDSNPIKWAGGFSLDHFKIGIISMCYGIYGMLAQFFIYPPVARSLGILTCLKGCVILFPVAHFLMPFTALLPTQQSQVAAAFCIMLLKCTCGVFAFPCSTILLTNSASSLRILGTLNGFATSFAGAGRAAGPAIGGAAFTLGVKKGFVVAPWWMLSAIAMLAAIPVFWLEEGEGFSGSEGHVSDEEEADEDDNRGEADEEEEGGPKANGNPRPDTLATSHYGLQDKERGLAYGDVGVGLSRTNTASSARSARSGQAMSPNSPSSWSISRGMVIGASIPRNIGNRPVSRRYSSSLGQSFGSTGGSLGEP